MKSCNISDGNFTVFFIAQILKGATRYEEWLFAFIDPVIQAEYISGQPDSLGFLSACLPCLTTGRLSVGQTGRQTGQVGVPHILPACRQTCLTTGRQEILKSSNPQILTSSNPHILISSYPPCLAADRISSYPHILISSYPHILLIRRRYISACTKESGLFLHLDRHRRHSFLSLSHHAFHESQKRPASYLCRLGPTTLFTYSMFPKPITCIEQLLIFR